MLISVNLCSFLCSCRYSSETFHSRFWKLILFTLDPKGHMMDGPPLVTTSRQDPPSPTSSQIPLLFYVLSLNSHFSACRPEKRGPVTLDSAALQLHTVRHCPRQVLAIPEATCRHHPLEMRQREHLPFLHAPLEAVTPWETIPHLRGWPTLPRPTPHRGLKMLIQSCPFFSPKIILPSAFKRICLVRTDHWHLHFFPFVHNEK